MRSAVVAIGLGPRVPLQPENRLCRALAEAFEVVFVAIDDALPPDLAGLIVVDGDEPSPSPDVPRLAYRATEPDDVHEAAINLAADTLIDQPFRDCELVDDEAPAGPVLRPREGERVLATTAAGPVWVTSESGGVRHDRVAARWPRMTPDTSLREMFRSRRFFDLLPLVHFVALACRNRSWHRPPLRAMFLLDDPNLHATRYGYLPYRHAVDEAQRSGYHLAIAMVPLDTWYTDRRTAGLFRDNPDQLSLLIHGNNHVRHELGREDTPENYRRLCAQGLRRIDAFARQQRVSVARVMAAPHGRCHENAARALLQTGYDGLCISRPFPWLDGIPRDRPVTDWFPAELVAGGLPVIPRYAIYQDLDDLRFRAWLGQPLIIYGHHQDVASGLDGMAAIAGMVDSLGPVSWTGLEGVVGSNFWTRVEGNTLDVKLFTSRATVPVPAGVETIRVRTPAIEGISPEAGIDVLVGSTAVSLDEDDYGRASRRVPCRGGDPIDLRLECEGRVDIRQVASPGRDVWPVVRRVLTETRDRLLPLLK